MKPIRSSLPYILLLYFNAWYLTLFMLTEIAVFIWKGTLLPYEEGTFAAEIILLIITGIAAAMQIRIGQQGNLTERATASVISLLLILAVLVGSLHLLLWQTYVLWIEAGLIFVELAFLAFEMVFACISIVTFARAPK